MLYYPEIKCAHELSKLSNKTIEPYIQDDYKTAGIMINDSFLEIEVLANMSAEELNRYGITSNDLLSLVEKIKTNSSFKTYQSNIIEKSNELN